MHYKLQMSCNLAANKKVVNYGVSECSEYDSLLPSCALTCKW